MDGFHEAVASTVKSIAEKAEAGDHLNIFPGFVSTEDLRQLKTILADFGIDYVMVPDFSETLDNPLWETYKRIPEGGTPIEKVKTCGSAKASIEFGTVLNREACREGLKIRVCQPPLRPTLKMNLALSITGCRCQSGLPGPTAFLTP